MGSALGLEQPGDGAGAAVPVCGLGVELFAAGTGEAVELRAAGVLRVTPLGVEPAGALESLEGGEERPRIDLEDAARDLFDSTRDAEAVERLEAQRLEDEHVQRA